MLQWPTGPTQHHDKYRLHHALTRISKICAARVENVSRAGVDTRPKVECSQLEIHSRSLAKAFLRLARVKA